MKQPIYDTVMLYDELQNLVKSMCDPTDKVYVVFSMFSDQGGSGREWKVCLPNIQSETPVVEGKVRFMIDYWRVTDEPVYTPYMDNPTWKDIIRSCNKLMNNCDGFGVFLEGFGTTDEPDTFEFVMGS